MHVFHGYLILFCLFFFFAFLFEIMLLFHQPQESNKKSRTKRAEEIVNQIEKWRKEEEKEEEAWKKRKISNCVLFFAWFNSLFCLISVWNSCISSCPPSYQHFVNVSIEILVPAKFKMKMLSTVMSAIKGVSFRENENYNAGRKGKLDLFLPAQIAFRKQQLFHNNLRNKYETWHF